MNRPYEILTKKGDRSKFDLSPFLNFFSLARLPPGRIKNLKVGTRLDVFI